MLLRYVYIWSIAFVLFSFSGKAQELIINEIMSGNISGITDAYGDNSDWIELYNKSSEDIQLGGYYLSDKNYLPTKWEFPNVTIGSKSYLLIFASEKESIGNELHCNFKLSLNGENILLSDPNEVLIDQIDSIIQQADISYGHIPGEANELKYFNIPTPNSLNNTTAYDGFIDAPVLSLNGGFFSSPIDVTASHNDANVIMHYTLDGSIPTENSLVYAGALHFENNASSPNQISLIKTNPSFDYPKPGYSELRANSRGWLAPFQTINKNNVLKIKAFKQYNLPSSTVSETYIINPALMNRYSMPVLSLSTESRNLFNDTIGIYVYGITGEEGNYRESGKEWERPVHIQFFEKDGSLAFEQNFGARIHGGGGRHSTIKNLRIYARDEYGKNSLKYKWFPNDDADEFKRFLIRGPGHRPDCFPRDDFGGLLIENQKLDIQHVRHVMVFINGEYWGIHSIKERFDQDYLELKYGKKEEDYVILKNTGTLDSGEPEDVEVYYNLLDYVENNDMSQQESYDYVKENIDIDNYLSYLNIELFLGNVDWVETNVKFWRYKGFDKSSQQKNPLDGRWRWFMFDFDLTLGGSCAEIAYTINVYKNIFDPSYGRATILSVGLKQNEQFVFDLVNRMCDMMNSTFNSRNMNSKINSLDESITAEMFEQMNRWRYPSFSETLLERQSEVPDITRWEEVIEQMHTFNDHRRRKTVDHMMEEFGLSDTLSLIVDVNDLKMGNVQVNTILISEALDGIDEAVYPWKGLYFQDLPIQLIAKPKLGYRFVEWAETGDTQDTLKLELQNMSKFTAMFEEDPDFIFEDALYINEFMAINKETIDDDFGSSSDWIEIYNPNAKAVDLASFYISDNAEDTFKYQFPVGYNSTVIEPYSYKLIWCDSRPERGPMYTNFKLSASGEDIVLLAPDSSLIDELSYGPQQVDVSYGRETDGEDVWKYFQAPVGPTPNATNNTAAINEYDFNNMLVYPNPVTQGKTLYFQEILSFKLYNNMGQLLVEKKKVSKLETSNLLAGVYIIDANEYGKMKLIVK